jgi:hypothetical protein
VEIVDRFEVGVRFLPIPLPWFTIHPVLTRYAFAYDPVDGSASIQQIDASEPGLVNIPPPVLAYAFDAMMNDLGIDARNEEVLAWIHEHGLADHVARLEALSSDGPTEEVRQRAALELGTIIKAVGADLMMREYLRFRGEVVSISERQVRQRFEEDIGDYTLLKANVAVFESEEQAAAFAAGEDVEPSMRSDIEVATGQPGLPADIKAALADLEPTERSGVVRLGDGRFAVLRLDERRVPTFEEIHPALRRMIREDLRIQSERGVFNRLFNEALNDKKPLVERGIHAYRGALLEASPGTDWRATAAAMAPRVLDDQTDVALARGDEQGAIAQMRTALGAARAELAALRSAADAVTTAGRNGGNDELRDLGRKLAREVDDRTKKLADLDGRLAHLGERAGDATRLRRLTDVEQERANIAGDIRHFFDDFVLGESDLEERAVDVRGIDPELAAPLIDRLGASKHDPRILALTTFELPSQMRDPTGRELAARFALPASP